MSVRLGRETRRVELSVEALEPRMPMAVGVFEGIFQPPQGGVVVDPLPPPAIVSGTIPGAPDVEGQFQALKHHAEGIGWHIPRSLGAPDPSSIDHYQGIVRYPGDGTPIFYVTQKDDDDTDAVGRTTGGYLHVVRLNSRGTDGERLGSNLQVVGRDTHDAFPPAGDTWLRSIRFNGVDVQPDGQRLRPYVHPGGMAIVDNVLFVGMDEPDGSGVGGKGMIVLFDLGPNGEFRESPRAIQAFSLIHKIDNLAVTETAGGKYLIWVNGDSGRVTRFYQTNGADIRANSLQIALLQNWNDRSSVDFGGRGNSFPLGTGAHQSSTFIRESNGPPTTNSPLYLLGMRHNGTPFSGEDFADLYRMTEKAGGGFKMTRVKTLHMFCVDDGAGRLCNMAAGNNAYVSPSGELILYSVQHDDENRAVNMAEFRHRDGNRPGSPLRLPTAHAGGPYRVFEGGAVTLNGAATPKPDRPWIELFDDNLGWLHASEHPDGNRPDRSIVVDYDNRGQYELNNFNRLDGFNDKTSSVRWRLPKGLDVEFYQHDNFRGQKVVLKGTGTTQSIGNLDSFNFGDKTSSMRFVGSAPGPSSLELAWDLDGDGIFGETGAAATRGDEVGSRPTFSASGLNSPQTIHVSLQVTDRDGRSDFSTAAIHVVKTPRGATTPLVGNLDRATLVDLAIGSEVDPGAQLHHLTALDVQSLLPRVG